MTRRALSEDRRLRFAVLAMLYAAQGIPDAMVLIVFPAFLAARGVAPAGIGTFLAIAMLPNAAKLIIGPTVDRWAYLMMGRRKPWIMAGELGIATSFGALALLPDPVAQLPLFTASAFCITLATAVQDVATDATAMDLIPPHEQGRANGVMWGSKTVGTAAFATLGTLILTHRGFSAMVAAALAILLAVFFVVALVRERPGERLLPWTRGNAAQHANNIRPESVRKIARQLFGALREKGAMRLIGLSLVIGMLLGLAGAMAPVMMVQKFSWSPGDYAQLRGTLKLVSGLAGMAIGGWLIDQVGHRTMLLLSLGGIAAANLALALAFTPAVATAYLIVFECLLVFAFITFFAATMQQCSRAIAATQFSFTMVCGNLTMAAGARLLGPLMALGGVPAVTVMLCCTALAGVALFALIPSRTAKPAAVTP
ncbi:MAG: MFS transporter [Pseudomonadota bacterium]